MKKILMALLVLLTIFTGCRPSLDPQINKTYLHEYKKCYAKCLDVLTMSTADDHFCGDDFKTGIYEASYCDKTSGFHLDDIALEIKPKVNELWNYIEDLEKQVHDCRLLDMEIDL